eukprot:CAMPEP_0169463048 /NCGR_PEP_ID=MMETSP1042-20121227/19890_1 /TAXON_ID=464988 /ORGANISM="Hemiselmis andersenii, Strain CCMP1180" /LENGTH=197 /DNA_ID=CAMNT_0009575735 /DNA_START=52 /DNA_END=642 /DNA_ORIENTATION=+
MHTLYPRPATSLPFLLSLSLLLLAPARAFNTASLAPFLHIPSRPSTSPFPACLLASPRSPILAPVRTLRASPSLPTLPTMMSVMVTVDKVARAPMSVRSCDAVTVTPGGKDASGQPLSVLTGVCGTVRGGELPDGVSEGDTVLVSLLPGEDAVEGTSLKVDASRLIPSPSGASKDEALDFLHVAANLVRGLGPAVSS